LSASATARPLWLQRASITTTTRTITTPSRTLQHREVRQCPRRDVSSRRIRRVRVQEGLSLPLSPNRSSVREQHIKSPRPCRRPTSPVASLARQLDGISYVLRAYAEPSDLPTSEGPSTLGGHRSKDAKRRRDVSYLPEVGFGSSRDVHSQCSIDPGWHIVNCTAVNKKGCVMTVHPSACVGHRSLTDAGVPIVGERHQEAQVVVRPSPTAMMAKLFEDRGVQWTHHAPTVVGNMDYPQHARPSGLESKKISRLMASRSNRDAARLQRPRVPSARSNHVGLFGREPQLGYFRLEGPRLRAVRRSPRDKLRVGTRATRPASSSDAGAVGEDRPVPRLYRSGRGDPASGVPDEAAAALPDDVGAHASFCEEFIIGGRATRSNVPTSTLFGRFTAEESPNNCDAPAKLWIVL